MARLSRVNSSTGSFSHRSLQTFRTVSLPGLLPGTSIGILTSGLLDKRRDGAVRGGWAKRLFILSTRGVHYYRKNEEYELFGKERGQVLLNDIGLARIVPPEDAPYGSVEPGQSTAFFAVISRKKSLLLFLRADSMELAMSWVNSINRAIQVGQAIQFAPKWSDDVIQKFTSAASGNFEGGSIGEAPVVTRPEEPVVMPPRILVVSVFTAGTAGPPSNRERMVKRQVDLEEAVEIGAFQPNDTCVIVLSDGEELQIPRKLLESNTQAASKVEKELVLTTTPRPRPLNPSIVISSRVHASFRCKLAPPRIPLPPQSSGIGSVPHTPRSALSNAFPGGLGGLFLLSCVVALWCGYPFESLMKITMVVGFVLAISQVGQFVISATMGKNSIGVSAVSALANTAATKLEDEWIYSLRVDKIEVIEQDQDLASPSPQSPNEAEAADSSEADMKVDSNASAISGGPVAFSPRFIAAEKGDEGKGRQRYENTLQWRRENDIDNILVRAHPTFHTIKKYYPQFFHGRTKTGLPVYYEQPGKIDLNGLKREGLSIEDLLRHYMYITEYLWRVIEPSDTGRSVTVLDVSGIGMSDLGGEVLDFIKKASAFTGAHYPERSSKIFIINIPRWFNMIWRMIKPLIDPVTREKIHMLKGSSTILKELEQHIDPDQIPSDLGGRGVALGHSPEEDALRDHVNKYLAQ